MKDNNFLFSCFLIIVISPFLICSYCLEQEELKKDRAGTSATAKVAATYSNGCKQTGFSYKEHAIRNPYSKCKTYSKKKTNTTTTECWTEYKKKILYYTKTFTYANCRNQNIIVNCRSDFDIWSGSGFFCENQQMD